VKKVTLVNFCAPQLKTRTTPRVFLQRTIEGEYDGEIGWIVLNFSQKSAAWGAGLDLGSGSGCRNRECGKGVARFGWLQRFAQRRQKLRQLQPVYFAEFLQIRWWRDQRERLVQDLERLKLFQNPSGASQRLKDKPY
jgi:hypothetical protein